MRPPLQDENGSYSIVSGFSPSLLYINDFLPISPDIFSNLTCLAVAISAADTQSQTSFRSQKLRSPNRRVHRSSGLSAEAGSWFPPPLPTKSHTSYIVCFLNASSSCHAFQSHSHPRLSRAHAFLLLVLQQCTPNGPASGLVPTICCVAAERTFLCDFPTTSAVLRKPRDVTWCCSGNPCCSCAVPTVQKALATSA